MKNLSIIFWGLVLVLTATCLLPTSAVAHPGSGIVADRQGQIYFVDTGSGLWKIDSHGTLTRLPGPALHWMTLDADNRFAKVRLPSGSGWEITQAGTNPTLLLASDFPITMGRDGNLYYPSPGPGGGLQILKLLPSGRTSVLANLPNTTAKELLRHINGIAVAPDGSVYYTENNAIRRITPKGQVLTFISNLVLDSCGSIPGTEANAPPVLRGLVVDSSGTIYVAASDCGSVLKVGPGGRVTTVLQLAGPWTPTGVVLFGSDLYVLEYFLTASDNRREWLPRVRKISPDGKSVIIASIDRH
ncbi:MAG: hypothetical protein A2Z27_00590 [candidate division Zixibacteria bacterium RBG_16_50_21]|nr:MAG: hypothetical protein A2Z27_00590 [candidate division Zixibacteria bacterium RBG_16_50_21]